MSFKPSFGTSDSAPKASTVDTDDADEDDSLAFFKKLASDD